ncbi:ABC transporter ATP-binding protein [Leucobacter celer]|jgi:ATP-binding cassette subfamily C protein|uniref:ABC transporter ATP-binding protein n=1 Tax=Leucobacter celer TaxID=668625 RepID=UPI0006A7CE5E|nr:ABC transporter ATP-binding protein [Leucobacter celer]
MSGQAHEHGRSAGALPIATGTQTLATAWTLLRARPLLFAGTVLVLLIGATCGLVAPWALGRLVDLIATDEADAAGIWGLGAAILCAAIVSAIASGTGIVLAARLFETGLAELRERFLDRALELPQSRVERAGTGDLVSRASDDVTEVSDAIPGIVPAFTAALFTIAVSLSGMAVIDVRLALALLITLPVYVFTVRWYLRTAPGVYAAERAAVATRAHHVLASLRGLDSVLAYRLSERHGARIAESSWEVVRWALRARIVQNMFFARLNLAEYLGIASLLIVAFWLVGANAITIGSATTALLIFLRLFDPIGQLLFVLDDAQSAAASLARIVGVIRTDPRPDAESPAPAVSRPSAGTGSNTDPDAVARLDGVDFAYDRTDGENAMAHDVLHGIDLRIGTGEHIALVGASGAGKSTIATLLAGLHEPRSGLMHRPERTLLLSQDTHVFADTLAGSLRLAAAGADDDALRDALRRVEAGALLDALPHGLDTRLGHGGHPLTAAQAQQLALARLVLADPDLAILDEATAEADSAEAGVLERAAIAAIRGRAALIVAHRLSQAAVCDRILVLENGRIVESGSHAQLIADGGAYAALWRAWSRRREMPPERGPLP